jgi:hypothetical protein
VHHRPWTGRFSGIRKGNSHSTILFEIVVVAELKDITIADRTTAVEESTIWTTVHTTDDD